MLELQSNVEEYLLCKLNISENSAFYLFKRGIHAPAGMGLMYDIPLAHRIFLLKRLLQKEMGGSVPKGCRVIYIYRFLGFFKTKRAQG